MKCPVCGLGNIIQEEDEFCSECGSLLNTPQWIKNKYKIKETHKEEIIFIGELGVDAVTDGKLPNGEPYVWSKANRRKFKRRR